MWVEEKEGGYCACGVQEQREEEAKGGACNDDGPLQKDAMLGDVELCPPMCVLVGSHISFRASTYW